MKTFKILSSKKTKTTKSTAEKNREIKRLREENALIKAENERLRRQQDLLFELVKRYLNPRDIRLALTAIGKATPAQTLNFAADSNNKIIINGQTE